MLNLLIKEIRALRYFQNLSVFSKIVILYQVNHLRFFVISSERSHQLVNNSKRRKDQQEENNKINRVSIIKEKLSQREKLIEDL